MHSEPRTHTDERVSKRPREDDNKQEIRALTEGGQWIKREALLEQLKEDKSQLFEEKAFVMFLLEHYGCGVKFASAALKNDPEIMEAAMRHQPRALEHKGSNWEPTRDFLLEAMEKDGSALEFVGKELQDDDDVVRTALESDGDAIEFASERLRRDKDAIRTAIKQYPDAIFKAPEEFVRDPEMVLWAVKCADHIDVAKDLIGDIDPDVIKNLDREGVKELDEEVKALLQDML